MLHCFRLGTSIFIGVVEEGVALLGFGYEFKKGRLVV